MMNVMNNIMKKDKILAELQKSLALALLYFVCTLWFDHFDASDCLCKDEFIRKIYFSLFFGFGFVALFLIGQLSIFNRKNRK